MHQSTPIVIVEDDPDDQEIMRSILKDLEITSEVKMFADSDEAYDYLSTTQDTPFIIFSDINLPKTDGISFKERIDNNPVLRKKSIPFVFFSTTANQQAVNKVYGSLSVQGFFVKPPTYNEAKEMVRLVLTYWYHCKHPNTFDRSAIYT